MHYFDCRGGGLNKWSTRNLFIVHCSTTIIVGIIKASYYASFGVILTALGCSGAPLCP